VRVDDLDRAAVGVHTGVNDLVRRGRPVGASYRRNDDGTDDDDRGDQDECVEDGRVTCVHGEYIRSSVISVSFRISGLILSPGRPVERVRRPVLPTADTVSWLRRPTPGVERGRPPYPWGADHRRAAEQLSHHGGCGGTPIRRE
jgi:hypothetical protein